MQQHYPTVMFVLFLCAQTLKLTRGTLPCTQTYNLCMEYLSLQSMYINCVFSDISVHQTAIVVFTHPPHRSVRRRHSLFVCSRVYISVNTCLLLCVVEPHDRWCCQDLTTVLWYSCIWWQGVVGYSLSLSAEDNQHIFTVPGMSVAARHCYTSVLNTTVLTDKVSWSFLADCKSLKKDKISKLYPLFYIKDF